MFNNVFSTATHTVPSLMSALALCTENCDESNFTNQKNLSLTDLANNLDIDTFLYSTQGHLGGHNLASKLLLDTKKKSFPYKNKSQSLLGNRYVSDIKDDEFFSKTFCKKPEIFKNKKSSLVFLHSYAGHGSYGGYTGHIDNKVKFSYPEYINKENFFFGHTRLSIIGLDEQAAKQPVFQDNKILVFNGEIYNYKELGDYSSDVFAIIDSYKRYGFDFVKHLDGEFAIVIYDADIKKIFFTTDVFGTKPLFYSQENGKFGFSSYKIALEEEEFSTINKLHANSFGVLNLKIIVQTLSD
mgnify:CR=1 FL=1